MNVEKLSPSGIKNFSGCQMQFYLTYILGYRFPAGKAACLGTIFHKTVETMAAAKKLHDDTGRKIHTDEETGIKCNITRLNLDKLTRECFDYYKKLEDFQPWAAGDYELVRKWVDKALDFDNGRYSPLNNTIIDTERYFKFPVKEEWAKTAQDFLNLNGFIDLVYKIDDNCYEILDWKTGARKDWNSGITHTYETLKDDIQLRLYHWAGHLLYGWDKDYDVTIFYVKSGGPYTIHYKKSDIEITKQMIKEVFTKIKDADIPSRTRSYKCTKFCAFGMNSFDEVSDITSIKEPTHFGIVNQGEKCTMCDQTRYRLATKGTEWVEENMSKKSEKKDK